MNLEALNARYVTPVTDARAIYNETVRMYAKAPSNTPILPATLRSEAILGVQQQIAFNILQSEVNTSGGNTGIRPTERRLQIADGFMVTDISVMFYNQLTAGTTPGNAILQTWENPAAVAVLPLTVGGFGLNAPSLVEAYNGSLDMTVNTTQYMVGLDMLHFKRIDTAQAGQLVFTASNTSQSYFRPDDAFYHLTPCVNLSGRDTIQFRVNLPDSTDFTLVANNRVVAVLLLRGLKVQNGAQWL